MDRKQYKGLIRRFTVPKNRRPKFELTLRIIDLSNIPLASGTCYVKWHLPSSTAAEHRGRTDKAVIKDHKAVFEHVRTLEIRLTIDRNQTLQESEIHFEVLQEYSVGIRGDRIVLGNIKLNLSEYVNKHDEDDGTSSSGAGTTDSDGDNSTVQGIVRRYLMQDSKVNSTLKVGIRMVQVEGDKNFAAPPLKSAMVFGGIAGIMSAERADPSDDDGHMPSLTSKTRDLSELQDTYRRTLAAAWACTSGELPPDRLVEDIFAGGDGGNMLPPPSSFTPRHHSRHQGPRLGGEDRDDAADDASTSDSESHLTVRGYSPSHARSTSSSFLSPSSAASNGPSRSLDTSPTFGHLRSDYRGRGNSGSLDATSKSMSTSSSSSNLTGVSGRGSIEQQMRHHHDREKQKQKMKHRRGEGGYQRSAHELTEFDVRDDLRSWSIEVQH